jgi:hypothetical protein
MKTRCRRKWAQKWIHVGCGYKTPFFGRLRYRNPLPASYSLAKHLDGVAGPVDDTISASLCLVALYVHLS